MNSIASHNPAQDYLDLLKQTLCASLYDESAWRRVEGPMAQNIQGFASRVSARVKRGILKALRQRNLLLVRTYPYRSEIREQGLDWPLFGYTMTGRHRLQTLELLLTRVLDDQIPGDIVETGVWRGGSMIFAKALLNTRGERQRTIWCADSFEGMPVPQEGTTDEDFSDRDYLSVSLEEVQANFERYGLLDDNVKFLKGWFCDTLPLAPIERIAVLRLDGDLYESTRDALLPLYDKVSAGGYVIVDDYNSWAGCKRAVDEFRSARGIVAPLVSIDPHAVYWRKEP